MVSLRPKVSVHSQIEIQEEGSDGTADLKTIILEEEVRSLQLLSDILMLPVFMLIF